MINCPKCNNETLQVLRHSIEGWHTGWCTHAGCGGMVEYEYSELFIDTTVTRDVCGFYTHPDYYLFLDYQGDENMDKFDNWLNDNNLEAVIDECDSDLWNDIIGGVPDWNPEKPDGDDWFIASIHEGEDDIYCIWIRKTNTGESNGANSETSGITRN